MPQPPIKSLKTKDCEVFDQNDWSSAYCNVKKELSKESLSSQKWVYIVINNIVYLSLHILSGVIQKYISQNLNFYFHVRN